MPLSIKMAGTPTKSVGVQVFRKSKLAQRIGNSAVAVIGADLLGSAREAQESWSAAVWD